MADVTEVARYPSKDNGKSDVRTQVKAMFYMQDNRVLTCNALYIYTTYIYIDVYTVMYWWTLEKDIWYINLCCVDIVRFDLIWKNTDFSGEVIRLIGILKL